MSRVKYTKFELPGFGTALAKLIGERTFDVRRVIVDDGGKNLSIDVWTDLNLNQDIPMTWESVRDTTIAIRLNVRADDEEADIIIAMATDTDRETWVDTRVPDRYEISSRAQRQTMIVILEIK